MQENDQKHSSKVAKAFFKEDQLVANYSWKPQSNQKQVLMTYPYGVVQLYATWTAW